VCSAPALATGGEQDRNRTVGSDSAAGEPSGNRRFPREKGRVNGFVLAVFNEGEQDQGHRDRKASEEAKVVERWPWWVWAKKKKRTKKKKGDEADMRGERVFFKIIK